MNKIISKLFLVVSFIIVMAGLNASPVLAATVKMADTVTVDANKVMSGYSEIALTAKAGDETEVFLLQCDDTTDSNNFFHQLKDENGDVAKNANSMSIQFYKNGNDTLLDQNKAGKNYVYSSESDLVSIKDALSTIPEIKGEGYWVLHFYHVTPTGKRIPDGWSFGIQPEVATEILDKLATVEGGSDCSLRTQFNSVYTLKSN